MSLTEFENITYFLTKFGKIVVHWSLTIIILSHLCKIYVYKYFFFIRRRLSFLKTFLVFCCKIYYLVIMNHGAGIIRHGWDHSSVFVRKTILISNGRLHFHTVHDSSQFLVLCLVHSSPNVTSKLQSKLTLVPSFCLERAGVQFSLCRSDVMEGLADWLIAKNVARLSEKKNALGAIKRLFVQTKMCSRSDSILTVLLQVTKLFQDETSRSLSCSRLRSV